MSTKHQHHDSKPREIRNYSRATMYLLDFRPNIKCISQRNNSIRALIIIFEPLSGVKINIQYKMDTLAMAYYENHMRKLGLVSI